MLEMMKISEFHRTGYLKKTKLMMWLRANTVITIILIGASYTGFD